MSNSLDSSPDPKVLIEVTENNGKTTTYTYDNAGRKVSESDPNRGTRTYQYDAHGNLVREEDAKGIVKTYTYDALSRLKTIQSAYGSITETVTHTYDGRNNGIGKKAKTIKRFTDGIRISTIKTDYFYDGKSRLEKRKIEIEGRIYTVTYTYDTQSRIKGVYVQDPSGYEFNTYYVYKNGSLFGIKSPESKGQDTSNLPYIYYVDKTDAMGHVLSEYFLNGVRGTKVYNQAGYLKILRAKTPDHYVQLVKYDYDGVGNVKTRDDRLPGRNNYLTEMFDYDALNRITSMEIDTNIPTPSFETSKTYRYNKMGNILQKGSIDDYSYYGSRPHAVRHANGKSYTYDDNGNMLTRGSEAITYTTFDKPYALTNAGGDVARFYYDADGVRYMKTHNKTTTHYIDRIFERTKSGCPKDFCPSGSFDFMDTAKAKYIGYFYFGDRLVAMQTIDGSIKTPRNDYVHTDALGSIHTFTGEDAQIRTQRSYEPFGEIRALYQGIPANQTKLTNRSFTGHEQISELDGFIHMGGRVYDSTIGRFISADIHVPHPYSTQSYNRYSYVRNNPLGFVDPSGYTDGYTDENGLYINVPPAGDKDTTVKKQKTEVDAAPTNGISVFTPSGIYVPGPLQRINFPDSPILNMAIASPLNFVNSYTNTALNAVIAYGETLEPHEAAIESVSSGLGPIGKGAGMIVIGSAKVARIAPKINFKKVERTIKETLLSSQKNITSKHTLNSDEALEVGERFLGDNYREIGKRGSGVFRSEDGIRQFRMDSGSLEGSHSPNVPHVHLEVYKPDAKKPKINNHIPFED